MEAPVDRSVLLVRARAMVVDERYSEALDLYSELLGQVAEEKGGMSFDVGSILLEYGKALFKAGQSKNRIFRDRQMEIGLVKKIAQMQHPGVETSIPDADMEDDGEEEEDELELAWANLETARLIFERGLGEEDSEVVAMCRSKLSRAYLQLADLGAENDQFDQSIEDYHKSLQFYDPADVRFYVDVCLQCAVCHLYLEKPEAALEEYESAIARLQGEDLAAQKDLAEMIPDLQSRVSDIRAQLAGDDAVSSEQRMFQEALGQAMKVNVLQGVDLLAQVDQDGDSPMKGDEEEADGEIVDGEGATGGAEDAMT